MYGTDMGFIWKIVWLIFGFSALAIYGEYGLYIANTMPVLWAIYWLQNFFYEGYILNNDSPLPLVNTKSF